MTSFRNSLNAYNLPADASILEPPPIPVERVTMEHPALTVMTDLRQVKAIAIPPSMLVEPALQVMIYAKVRLVIVLDHDACVTGLVSARDLMGEEPVRVAREQQLHHNQITVEQVMTSLAQIEPLHIHDVESASVGDVVRNLRDNGRQHALVIEPAEGKNYWVRGIFSVTQIGRHLGVTISPDGHAQSFAELEHLLAADDSLV